jgi:hypothetical protein
MTSDLEPAAARAPRHSVERLVERSRFAGLSC